jgi:hypothetical protein
MIATSSIGAQKRLDRCSRIVLLLLVLSSGCGRGPARATPGATSVPATAPQTGPTPGASVRPVPLELPDVIARVNGEPVERWELESAVKQAEAAAGTPVPPAERDRVFRKTLDDLVVYHMFAQQARAEHLIVPPATLEARVKTIRATFSTEDAFEKALVERGLTLERLRAQEQRALEYQQLLTTEVESRVHVGEADVQAFYEQNIAAFKQEESVRVAHIFLPFAKDATPAQKTRVRAQSENIWQQVKKGGNFAALAKRYSDDTSADNGGDLGFFEKGDYPPDFEAVAFALKPGETSGVVELSGGYDIIRVLGRRAPRTAPLTEVRNDITSFLAQTAQQTRLDEFLKALKARTKIDVLL